MGASVALSSLLSLAADHNKNHARGAYSPGRGEKNDMVGRGLALREMEAFTRTGLAVLLALDLARVAGEQTMLTQYGPVFFV